MILEREREREREVVIIEEIATVENIYDIKDASMFIIDING